MSKDQIDALLARLDTYVGFPNEAADCIRELQAELDKIKGSEVVAKMETLREQNRRIVNITNKARINSLENDNDALIQRYGELQEAARKVIRYWGIRHESYLKEYVMHMDSVIQRHIQEAE